ncbi:MAG: VOC family protein [Aquaticitalea sp.]
MNTKKIWANLSATDLKKTQKFNLEIGFRLNGEPTKELVSFLVGEDDFVIHFFEEERLKSSMEGEIANLNKGNEVMFTLSADSKEEVEDWAKVVKNAGGTVFSEPQNIINDKWYGCGFTDPDGHKFNIFYNGNKE